MIKELKFNYGYLFEIDLLNEIDSIGIYKEFKPGKTIIETNCYIVSIPLLLEGVIKILRVDKNGDELVLYYLEKGDTCAVTLSYFVGQTKSKIRAVTETNVKVLMIPKEKTSLWLRRYKSWLEFILQSYHYSLQEFIETVDTIAFLSMDKRLYKYLIDKALVNQNNLINVTHQEIANDLHTSRVVISRLLKSLEKQGKIKLKRSLIKVIEI